MKWEGQRQSDNVEDRRNDDDGGAGGGGFGVRRVGIGAVVLALVGAAVFHVNPLTVLGLLGGGAPASRTAAAPGARVVRQDSPEEERRVAFVKTVLADTEDVWKTIFLRIGIHYHDPMLVLFRGSTPTACGTGRSATGPFYCPADEKVYIDLAFYDTLRDRLGAPGDFAQAYVIAHEIGHHVQKVLGTFDKVDAARRHLDEAHSNALSVRLELQADCFAGVWANHAQRTKRVLEPGDIESALNAAAQIGDDTLQRHARGTVVPETFTHGTSAQRVHWFRVGFDSGEIDYCDTFRVRKP
ncbi:MAG TPA: neutral zinc metallopeptidase [Burkholderiaceae bacterium]